jgi:hypothetical protein
LIELPDGFFGDGPIGIIDESETARTAGFPVRRQDDLSRFTDARQVIAQICLCRGIRQIAYEQTN